ncbi:hypothetical protein [Methanococcus maripaludis]|uniref:N-acetyltransferase domain-containing protein n=1 Tax=Methanococcus maripaludis TaxID=39152 RepID=A0A7J9SCN1_METMI|nr:hypothetical protein [Methanococcus maripaludis]MBB6497326.1 hypothetical protein [Methanococcus maripaludis]
MRVLLDTNIFIYREDDSEISEELQELSRLLNERATILIHPKSREDIRKDTDEERKQVMLSKLNSYACLEYPPSPGNDSTFNSTVGSPRRSNDDIDNHILYAVYRNAVNYLITEDRGIHKKAVQLGLKNRVLSLNEALGVFNEYYREISRKTLSQIKHIPIHNLHLTDPIFNSLRDDYPEFDDWFSRKASEGRKCWCYLNEGNIGAILIYTANDNDPILTNPPRCGKRRFKICTLKVDYLGHKLGELLLKQALDFCVDNSIDEIYLTHFAHSGFDHLVDLVMEYGFEDIGLNERGENVYLKSLNPSDSEIAACNINELFKKFYPKYYDGTQVKKFVIPIIPQYHERLFTGYHKRTNLTLKEWMGDFITEGNTIKKAYISHSSIRNMRKGDVLLFYRSRDHKELTTLGILEEFKAGLTSSEEIINMVGKRTVYSAFEIEKIAKKPTTVMIFTMHFHLDSPIPLKVLKANSILRGPPISVTEISHSGYEQIKELGGVNGNLTIH